MQLTKQLILQVVESADQADFTLTVLDRGYADTGTTTTRTTRGLGEMVGTTKHDKAARVTIALTAGTYRKEFSATDGQWFGGWIKIAEKLADQVEQWARANAATLKARRQ